MTSHRPLSRAANARIVRQSLRIRIDAHARLVARTDRLALALLRAIDGKPTNLKSVHASSMLLGRVVFDLKCCLSLARGGYLLQSWSLATSLLENAWSIGYIGTDEQRAERWFEHQELERTPWKARSGLRATLRLLELEDQETLLYRHFTNLSAAKHGNPLLQRRFGVTRDSTGIRVQLGPFYSEGVVRMTRFVLLWSVQAVCLSLAAFDLSHLRNRRFARRVVALQDDVRLLAKSIRSPN